MSIRQYIVIIPLKDLVHEALALARAHAELQERLSRRFVPSKALFRLLSALGPQGRTVPQVARELGLSRQSVQRVADKLVELHLARFVPNPNHRRSPILLPTEEGARASERIGRELAAWESRLEEVVEPEDLETAGLVLKALRSALQA